MGVIDKRVIGEWGTMLPDLLNFFFGGGGVYCSGFNIHMWSKL